MNQVGGAPTPLTQRTVLTVLEQLVLGGSQSEEYVDVGTNQGQAI